jgi:hypothetical protein
MTDENYMKTVLKNAGIEPDKVEVVKYKHLDFIELIATALIVGTLSFFAGVDVGVDRAVSKYNIEVVK